MPVSMGFIGRGSYYKEIIENLGTRNRNVIDFTPAPAVRIRPTQVLVNYGLHSTRRDEWSRRWGQLADQFQVKLNDRIFGNKLECVLAVERAGVPVPESKPTITQRQILSHEWIQKPYWSFGGRGISMLGGDVAPNWSKCYAQKRVQNRRYELRVHVFRWLPKEQWLVAKRVHPEGEAQLTWNHHQGGSFNNIEMNESNTGVFKRAKEYAATVAATLGYDFCSVDFIVQNASSGPLPIFFIEANLATGFTTDTAKQIYCDAFYKLSNMSLLEVQQVLRNRQDPAPAPTAPTPNPPPSRPAARQRQPYALTDADKLRIIGRMMQNASAPAITNEELILFINSLR